MNFTLENEQFTATIKSLGAELVSYQSKETGIEYIWNGNPEYWARHTPVLFPHVGKLKDDTLIFQGKSYSSTQHGFARDKEFTLVEQTDETIVLSLRFDEETLARYPFQFELLITYTLSAKGIETKWTVKNLDAQEKMYFGIGGHPAFNVPLTEGLTFEDYYFELSPKGMRTRIPFVVPYLDVAGKFDEEVEKIAIFHEQFHNDALIYETKGHTEITIKSDKSPHALTLSYDNIDYVGLWSPYPKESPFVCIEPWCSFADTTEDSGIFDEKSSVQVLQPLGVFETSYWISAK
ncbi:Galactose mutarotase [Pilibacter termitis]|uniref:Galactose mutarotase n=1 Tax=Pilibacter termitis TaxID=263852 RepID=A0A1T4LCY5_9ENTE|nr:aldose 1-epimerase family protein [Pilibacter termitis]SJZ52550.1 Galactose mutarotase [Pilibacter termitis]